MRERGDEWCGPLERETSDPTVTCSVQGSKWGTLVCFEGGGCRSGGETSGFRGGRMRSYSGKIASGMRWRREEHLTYRGEDRKYGLGHWRDIRHAGSQSAAGSGPRGLSSQVPRPLGTLRAQMTSEAIFITASK